MVFENETRFNTTASVVRSFEIKNCREDHPKLFVVFIDPV